MHADRPEEDLLIMEHTFLSESYGIYFNLPDYVSKRREEDAGARYAFHNQFLNFLEDSGLGGKGRMSSDSERRWLLKYPFHAFHLPELFRQYPDARVIVTHRTMSQVCIRVNAHPPRQPRARCVCAVCLWAVGEGTFPL